MKRVGLLLLIVLVSGCTNFFNKFYRAGNPQAIVATQAQFVPPPAKPALFLHSDDLRADQKRMAEDGYILIGYSDFYAPAKKVHEDQAVEQGKAVGASVVLYRSKYKDTNSGVIPYTVANPAQVSTVNTSGTVYGNSGSANYNSTSTVTSPGGYSTYAIPYSVTRNDYFASYWAKRDPNKIHLGCNYGPLPDDLRRKLERNTGVVVSIVVRGTPAFKANILEGDVLLKLNGKDVIDVQSLSAVLNELAGQQVTFDLLRNDQSRTITVTLNP